MQLLYIRLGQWQSKRYLSCGVRAFSDTAPGDTAPPFLYDQKNTLYKQACQGDLWGEYSDQGRGTGDGGLEINVWPSDVS